MNLTPDQWAKRQKEFEDHWKNEVGVGGQWTSLERMAALSAWKAAWRPIPSVKEIYRLMVSGESHEQAKAIHRAFGGENEPTN